MRKLLFTLLLTTCAYGFAIAQSLQFGIKTGLSIASESLVDPDAARAVDENHPDAGRLGDMVKVFASQEILEVCRHAVELHGGYGAMLETGVEKYFRDAAVYLHMDATVDVSNFKIVKAMFPQTAGAYAGPE